MDDNQDKFKNNGWVDLMSNDGNFQGLGNLGVEDLISSNIVGNGILTNTTLLKDISNSNLRLFLEGGYNNPQLHVKLLTSMINSVFTQKTPVFLMSYRSSKKLFKNDVNLIDIKLWPDMYKYYKLSLHQSGILVTLRNPVGKKSGVYKINNPVITSILEECLGIDYLKTQEEGILEFYDTSDLEPEDLTQKSKDSRAKWNKILKKEENNG